MTTPTDPPLRVSDPSEILALIPYLVGFHPHDSLVVVGARPDHQVSLVVRTDLPQLDPIGDQVITGIVGALTTSGATGALLVVYDTTATTMPTATPLPEENLVQAVAAGLHTGGIDVGGALYVTGDRWWTYHPCPDPTCCPPRGRPMPGPDSRVAAEATYAGLVALPDRAAVAATLDPYDTRGVAAHCQRLDPLWRHREQLPHRRPWLEVAATRMRRALTYLTATTPVPWLEETAVARLVVGLRHRAIRDAAWGWSDAAPHRMQAAEQLWQQLARRAPQDYRAAPLFLTAWTAWRRGHGALAILAVDHCLAIDHGYSAAHLLQKVIASGIDPRTIPPLTQHHAPRVGTDTSSTGASAGAPEERRIR